MAKEEDDDNLPDKDAAKEFYAKYEPKEIIGRYADFFLLVAIEILGFLNYQPYF